MNGRSAALLLCGLCAVLAVLLLAGTIRAFEAGGAFAVALAILGVSSGGFRKRRALK